VKPYLDAILNELKADRKKAIALSSVLAIGLLLWGRLLISDEVPRVATAKPDRPVAASTSSPPTPAPATTGRSDEAAVRLVVPEQPPRDLFSFDPSPYKPTPENVERQSPSKLPVTPADVSLATEQVVQQARALQVQSVVIHGASPQALINGRLVGVGETIEGFEIVSMQERSIVVRKQGILVRIGL